MESSRSVHRRSSGRGSCASDSGRGAILGDLVGHNPTLYATSAKLKKTLPPAVALDAVVVAVLETLTVDEDDETSSTLTLFHHRDSEEVSITCLPAVKELIAGC